MKHDLEYNLTTFYTGEVQLRHKDYLEYEHLNPLHLYVDSAEERIGEIGRVEGVDAVVPRLSVPGAVFKDGERTGLQAVGVDFAREKDFSDISRYIVAGSLSEVTAAAAGEPRITPVVVGNGVLDRLGVAMGDPFTLVVRTARRGTNAMTFQAAAVADFPVQMLNEMVFWAPLDRIQRLAQMPGGAGEILVKLDNRASAQDVTTAITAAAPDLEVRHFTDIETTYSMIELAITMYNIIALFFFLLASTVVVNTTMMVIFERRREIGTLEAMGMRSREVLRMFLSEAVILGFLGAVAGLILGIGISLLLGEIGIDFSKSMEGVDMEISPIMYPVLNLRSTVFVFFFAVIVAGVTAYFPTRKIIKIEPVAALREE